MKLLEKLKTMIYEEDEEDEKEEIAKKIDVEKTIKEEYKEYKEYEQNGSLPAKISPSRRSPPNADSNLWKSFTASSKTPRRPLPPITAASTPATADEKKNDPPHPRTLHGSATDRSGRSASPSRKNPAGSRISSYSRIFDRR